MLLQHLLFAKIIQESDLSQRKLAKKFGISRSTVRRWKYRDSVEDKSHRPHRMRTTLTPEQEIIVVELRKTLLPPLYDPLAVVLEFNHPKISRSALERKYLFVAIDRASRWVYFDIFAEKSASNAASLLKRLIA